MEHHTDLTSQARQHEQEGKLEEAAALYEKIVEKDSLNELAIKRLLILYRKLKQYRKEMQLLNASIKANAGKYQQQQTEWGRKHPKAAKASKLLLKTLNGTKSKALPSYEEPIINTWRKRKENLAKKLQKK